MTGERLRLGFPAVEAVVFDLDDTLIVETAQPRLSLRAIAPLVPGTDPDAFADLVLETAWEIWRAGPHRRQCRDLGITSWEGLWSTFEGNHRSVDDLRTWAAGYRPATWSAVLARLELHDEALGAALGEAFVAAQRAGHPLVDGADRVVRGLAETHRIGLLTNGPSDIQRHKFEATGLTDCFDAVVVSGELGLGKPDPGVFDAVLAPLGTTPATTIMVGDSWERDVIGARGLGMTAVWVAAGRPRPDADSPDADSPDIDSTDTDSPGIDSPEAADPGVAVVDSVADLPGLMSSWAAG